MTKSVLSAIYNKPDDQGEWGNILQLMYHLRQALACSMCGKLVSAPYTPVQEPCHCICANCRSQLDSTQLRHNCVTCRKAFEIDGESGFEINNDLNYTAVTFVKMCKVLVYKDMEHKWSNLQVSTQNGPITFGQLIREGYNSDGIVNGQNLSDKFRKRTKNLHAMVQKEHQCRCGSGAKKNNGGESGNKLTCIGQRCACYKEGKACVNCKCIGCKNPKNPKTSNGFHNSAHGGDDSLNGRTTTSTVDSPLV